MMFIVYMVLFLGGFYLFGLSFNLDSWQGAVFTAGILAISLALALVTRQNRPDKKKKSQA